MYKKKSKQRILFLTLRGLVFILISAYALFNVYGYRYDVKNKVLRETGVIEVRSFPQNVSVSIDGTVQIQGSPSEVKGIEVGQHTVRFDVPGFIPFEKKIEIGKQFVVRFGDIFLLPQNPEKYSNYLSFSFDTSYVTQHYIVLYSSSTKRIGLYEKGNKNFAWIDSAFSSPLVSVIERAKGNLLFILQDSIVDVEISSHTFQKLSLLSPAQDVTVVPWNNAVLLYVSNNKIYSYNILTKENRILLDNGAHISFLSSQNLLFCDSKQNLSTIPVNKLFDTPKNSSVLISKDGCDIKDVIEQKDTMIFIQGDNLIIGKNILEQGVKDIIFSSGDILFYRTDRAIYSYDMVKKEKKLFNRFSGIIENIVMGPDDNHFFAAVDKDIIFCNIENEFCETFMSMNTPFSLLWYDRGSKRLLIKRNGELYVTEFDFW